MAAILLNGDDVDIRQPDLLFPHDHKSLSSDTESFFSRLKFRNQTMRPFRFQNAARGDDAGAVTLEGIPTGKYTLEHVGEGKEGRPQNTSASVHGLEETRGRYASCKGHSVDASTWLPSSKETEPVEATGDNESSRLERFEEQQGGDTHFPVDYTKPLNAFGASLDTDQQWKEHGHWRLGGDIEDSKSIQERERRPASRDSRVLMYKGGGGANLEVDVPARGFGRRLFADASHLGGTESFFRDRGNVHDCVLRTVARLCVRLDLPCSLHFDLGTRSNGAAHGSLLSAVLDHWVFPGTTNNKEQLHT